MEIESFDKDNLGTIVPESLYKWNESQNELEVIDEQLALANEISCPLTYYGQGSYEVLKMDYVSDIHLLHHMKYCDDDPRRTVRDTVKKLYKSQNGQITIFCGDISSSVAMTMKFFLQYKLRYNLSSFKKYKKRLQRLKKDKVVLSSKTSLRYEKELKNISKYIQEKKMRVNKKFDFQTFEKYRKKYHSDVGFEEAYDYYKNTRGFKKSKISKKTEEKIVEILALMNRQEKYLFDFEKEKCAWEKKRIEINERELVYQKNIEELSVRDYVLQNLSNTYLILGNHEFIEFPDIKSGVSFYKEQLSKLGVIVLHNEYVSNDKYLLYGGTGFAKYDEKWNASTIVCCSGFSREDEIRETTVFEKGYKKALNYAKKKGLCFICATHYPVDACLNGAYDREVIYFSGHNHRNEYVKKEDKVLYADNQIGYTNNNIAFKLAITGYEINPYGELSDGLFETNVEDYLKFYRYLGENIGDGKLLYMRCQNGRLYIVKRKGYYGFFIVSEKKDSKGISIVNGGSTKRLTSSTEISWVCENFDVVVSKYLQMLLPLRRVQEAISKELKELGLDGTIHGLIIDVNKYHHIAYNPETGCMEFYYSSIWGLKRSLNSFDEVILSLEYHKSKQDMTDYKLLRKKYEERSKNNGYLLNMASEDYILEEAEYTIGDRMNREEQLISRTDGMYGVSRKIAPLQRLFSGRVLRDFDLRLTETKQHMAHRKKLYKGRLFRYEGIRYQIIEDDGSDFIMAEELQKGSRIKGNAIRLSGTKRRFVVEELKRKIKRGDCDTFWIDE